jgi:hypothetical protein
MRNLTRLALLVALALCGSARAQMGMSDEEEELLEEMGVRGTPMGRRNQEPKPEVRRRRATRSRRAAAPRRAGARARALRAHARALAHAHPTHIHTRTRAQVLRADLPLIKCEVCRRVTALALEHAKETLAKRFAHASKRRHEFTQFDGEAEVADYIEKVYASAGAAAGAGAGGGRG